MSGFMLDAGDAHAVTLHGFTAILGRLSDPGHRCQGPELTCLLQALCKQLITAANETSTVILTSAERARNAAAEAAAADASADLCISAPEHCVASPGPAGPVAGAPSSILPSSFDLHALPPSAVSASSTLPGNSPSLSVLPAGPSGRPPLLPRAPQARGDAPPARATKSRSTNSLLPPAGRTTSAAATSTAAPPLQRSRSDPGNAPAPTRPSPLAPDQPPAPAVGVSTMVCQGIQLLVEHLEHFHYRAKGVALDGLLTLSAVGLTSDRRLDPAGFASVPAAVAAGATADSAAANAAAAFAAAVAAAAAAGNGEAGGSQGLQGLAGLDADALNDAVGALGGLGLGDWLALKIVEAGAVPRLLELLAQRTGINMVPVRQLASQVMHNLARRRNAAVRSALARWRPLPGLISALDVVLEDYPDIAARLLLVLADLFPSTAHQLAGPLHKLLAKQACSGSQQAAPQQQGARAVTAAVQQPAAGSSQPPQGGKADREEGQQQQHAHGEQLPPLPPAKGRRPKAAAASGGVPPAPRADGAGAAAGSKLPSGKLGSRGSREAGQGAGAGRPDQPLQGEVPAAVAPAADQPTSTSSFDPQLGLAPEVDVSLEDLLVRVGGYYMRLPYSAVLMPRALPPVAPPPDAAGDPAAQQREAERAAMARRVEEHRRKRKEGMQLDCCVAALLAAGPMPVSIFDLLSYSYGKAVSVLKGPLPTVPLAAPAAPGCLWRPFDLLPYALSLLQSVGGGADNGDTSGSGLAGAGHGSGGAAAAAAAAAPQMLAGLMQNSSKGASSVLPPRAVALCFDRFWGLDDDWAPGSHSRSNSAGQLLLGPCAAALELPGPGPALPGAPYGDRPVNEGLVRQLSAVVQVVLQRATQAADALPAAVGATATAATLVAGNPAAVTAVLSQARQVVVLSSAVLKWVGGALAAITRAQVATCIAEEAGLIEGLANSVGRHTGCTAAAAAQSVLVVGLANVWACAHASAASRQQQLQQQRRRRSRQQGEPPQNAQPLAAETCQQQGEAANLSGSSSDARRKEKEGTGAAPAPTGTMQAPGDSASEGKGPAKGAGGDAAKAAAGGLRRSARLKRQRDGQQPTHEAGTALGSERKGSGCIGEEVSAPAPAKPASAHVGSAPAGGVAGGQDPAIAFAAAAAAAAAEALLGSGAGTSPGAAAAHACTSPSASASMVSPGRARRDQLLAVLVDLLASRLAEARTLHEAIEQQQQQQGHDPAGDETQRNGVTPNSTDAAVSALLVTAGTFALGEGPWHAGTVPAVMAAAAGLGGGGGSNGSSSGGSGEAGSSALEARARQSLEMQALLVQAVALLLPGLDAGTARRLVDAGAAHSAVRLMRAAAQAAPERNGPGAEDEAQKAPGLHAPEGGWSNGSATYGVSAVQALGVMLDLLRVCGGGSFCAGAVQQPDALAALGGAVLLRPSCRLQQTAQQQQPVVLQQLQVLGSFLHADSLGGEGGRGREGRLGQSSDASAPSPQSLEVLNLMVSGQRPCAAHDTALELLPALVALTRASTARCAAARSSLIPVLLKVARWSHSKAQRRRLLLQALAVWAPQLQPLLLQLPLVSSPPAPALEGGTALDRQGPAVASTSCDPALEPAALAGCGAAGGVGAMRTRASQRVRGPAGSGACKAPAGPNHSSSTNNHSQSTVLYGRQQEGTPTTGAPHLPAGAAMQGTGASSQQQPQRTPSWRGVGAGSGSGNGRGGSQVANGPAPAGPSAAFVSPTRQQHSSASGVGAAGAAHGAGQQRRAASRLAVASPPPAAAAAGTSQVAAAGGGKGRAASAAGAGRTTPSTGAAVKGTSGAMAAPPPLPPRLGGRAVAAAVEEGRAASAAEAAAGGVLAVGSAEAVAARRSLCGLLEAVGEHLMDAEVVRHLHATGWLRTLSHGSCSADPTAQPACRRVLGRAASALLDALQTEQPPPALALSLLVPVPVPVMAAAGTGEAAAPGAVDSAEGMAGTTTATLGRMGLLLLELEASLEPIVRDALYGMVPELRTAVQTVRLARADAEERQRRAADSWQRQLERALVHAGAACGTTRQPNAHALGGDVVVDGDKDVGEREAQGQEQVAEAAVVAAAEVAVEAEEPTQPQRSRRRGGAASGSASRSKKGKGKAGSKSGSKRAGGGKTGGSREASPAAPADAAGQTVAVAGGAQQPGVPECEPAAKRRRVAKGQGQEGQPAVVGAVVGGGAGESHGADACPPARQGEDVVAGSGAPGGAAWAGPPQCPSPERHAPISLQLTAREAALAAAVRQACMSIEAALAARRHDLAAARAAEQAAAAVTAAAATSAAAAVAAANAAGGGKGLQQQQQQVQQLGAGGVVADADYLSHTYRGVSKRLNFDDL